MGNLPFSRTVTLIPGDGVPSNLLNEIQDRIIAVNARQSSQIMLTDQILQSMAGAFSNAATRPDFGGDDGANISTLWAYCVSPGHAFLRLGSANNKIQVAPGTLLQKVANSDGLTLVLIPYSFSGTEEWTLANGDATNPRVDLLQMQLTYAPSTNTATASLTVKQGTPAASPIIPDPDSGFVPVGAVVVGNGWTTGGSTPTFGVDQTATNNAVVHDHRMPMRVRRSVTEPPLFKPVTSWTTAADNRTSTASSGTNQLLVPYAGELARLVGLKIEHSAAFAGVSIGSIGTIPTPAGFRKANSLASANTNIRESFSRSVIDAAHLPAAGPTVLRSAVQGIGVPLWSNGFRVPGGVTGAVAVDTERLAVIFSNDTNGQVVGAVTWLMATGL